MTATTAPAGTTDKALSTVARGGSLNLLGSVCTAIMTFALAIVLTRELGAEGAGPYFVAIPIFQILIRCSELGVSTGLVRWISQARVLDRTTEIKPILRSGVAASVLAGVVLMSIGLASAGALADLVTRSEASAAQVGEILPVFFVSLPFASAFFALVNGSRGFGTMKPTALLDRMVRPTAQLVLVVAALAADLSTRFVAMAWVLPYYVLALVGAVWINRLSVKAQDRNPESTAARPFGIIAREFWSFTLPRAVAAVFQGTSLWLNPIMVSALAGTAAAAIYTSGYRYLQLGTFLALAVGQSVQPLISQAIARTAVEDAQQLFETTSSWLTLFVAPLYMAVAIFAVPLLSLFGPEFVEARWALVALASAAVFSAVCGPVDTVLLMGGRSVLSTYNMALGLATNVVLNLILIPAFGITGAGIAFGAAMIVINLAPLIQVKRHLSLSPFGEGTRIAAVLAVVVFFPPLVLGRIVAGESMWAAVGVSGFAAMIYAPFVWRFREQLKLAQFASIVGRGSKGSRPPKQPPSTRSERGGSSAPQQSSPPVPTSPMARVAAASFLVVPLLAACSGSTNDASSASSPTTTVSATVPEVDETPASTSTLDVPDPSTSTSTVDVSDPSTASTTTGVAAPEPERVDTPAPDEEDAPAEPSEAQQLDEGARLACANAELALFDLLEAAPDGPGERVEAAASWAADSQFEEFRAFSTSLSASASGDDLEASLQNVLTTCEERGYERF